MKKSNGLSPFIRWAGGKRQLLDELLKYKPDGFDTYYEPFIGGGAFLLGLAPNKAVINDSNEELVITWKEVKNHVDKLKELLEIHEQNNNKEYYLNVRSWDRDQCIGEKEDVERAARFIYLNKAGFNGMWRVNSKGQNNIPYAGRDSVKLIPKQLDKDSLYLRKNDVKITCKDYKEVLKEPKKGDFVYLDPPYIPVNETSTFTQYTKEDFSIDDHKELAKIAKKLTRRGVYVMISNSKVDIINKLFNKSMFNIHEVDARRMINSNANKRGKIKEVIITNY